MKLAILGATGGTGLEMVRKAIEYGHSVTAFVRSPEGLKSLRDQITVRQGDLLNSAQLADAIRGHDAVLSGFGPRLPISPLDSDLMRRFAGVLSTAMAQAKVSRILIESSAFLFKDALMPPAYLIGRLFFAGVVKDLSAMERIVKSSGLDWTLLRPPQLTDDPYTGRYRVRYGHLPLLGFKVSRADVADCFMKTVADPASIRRVVGVSR
jgi:putative NADH-flavin reductase